MTDPVKLASIVDAVENVVIAQSMGWDMEGVLAVLREALQTRAPAAAAANFASAFNGFGDWESEAYSRGISIIDEEDTEKLRLFYDYLAATGRIATDTTAMQAEIEELKQALSGRTVSCDACSGLERRELMAAVNGLVQIVEGVKGTMEHGTWHDGKGLRLKDTEEWVKFYNAAGRCREGGE
jgi:hypothetical protein